LGQEREITWTLYWMEMLEVIHGRAAGEQHPWLPTMESLAVNRGGTPEPHALHLSSGRHLSQTEVPLVDK
jgi:hypothetical protein